MSILDKVIEIVNQKMDTEANQILGELKDACPKRTGQTAASFHIMGSGKGATASIGGKGFITNVRIGSTRLSAKYASEGNGGSGKVIKSTRKYDRLGREPGKLLIMNGMHTMYATSVHGYTPATNFVKDVADRHR